MNLQSSIESIKGVGPKTAEQLRRAGLLTVDDVIHFFPYKYDDFSEVVAIADIVPGKRTIRARCESVHVRAVRRGMSVVTATFADDSGKLQAVWFNQPYRVAQLETAIKPKVQSTEFYVSGEFEFRYNRYQLTNPSVEKVSDMPVHTDRLLPVYRSIQGIKSQVLRKILVSVRPLLTMLPETLPEETVRDEKLVHYSDAVMGMHFPKTQADITEARARLGFEELFHLLLAARLNKDANTKLSGYRIPFNLSVVRDFVVRLPFQLTNAQRRAAWEIIQDFERSTPMNRLLQGDVGSGKTVVAGIAALQAATAGYQSVIVAPTEILARQHAETLRTLLEPFDITVGLLIGAVTGGRRKLLYEEIEQGSVQVVVGTHAVLQDAVHYHRLGFVAVDEQHRFGVHQRQKLLEKAHTMPHLLSMTATPIPRSLQLTVFGELDCSVLDEKPANRLPITTKIVSPVSIATVYKTIDQQIDAGRQVYVICPLIDSSTTSGSDKKSVEVEYKKLKNSIFGHRRIALLHGKMKPQEKEAVMNEFKDHHYDIVVSTTVVEVGVDVPNATVMMIENADQFGLSQLHQLRGRVGRSQYQSYCYLVMSDTSRPSQRLRELEKSNDGFYLAEVDLKLRGPGEIYGRAQHGALNLQVATITDTALIAKTQRAVKEFMARGDSLVQYNTLHTQVQKYQRLTTLN